MCCRDTHMIAYSHILRFADYPSWQRQHHQKRGTVSRWVRLFPKVRVRVLGKNVALCQGGSERSMEQTKGLGGMDRGPDRSSLALLRSELRLCHAMSCCQAQPFLALERRHASASQLPRATRTYFFAEIQSLPRLVAQVCACAESPSVVQCLRACDILTLMLLQPKGAFERLQCESSTFWHLNSASTDKRKRQWVRMR